MRVHEALQNLSKTPRAWGSWVQLNWKLYLYPLAFERWRWTKKMDISRTIFGTVTWKAERLCESPFLFLFQLSTWSLTSAHVGWLPSLWFFWDGSLPVSCLEVVCLYLSASELYSCLLLLRKISEIMSLREQKLSILLSRPRCSEGNSF